MISTKEKNKTPKDSMTLLPCFYFVEIMVGGGTMCTACSPAVGPQWGGPVGEGSTTPALQLNSFLRRTVRFVGRTFPSPHATLSAFAAVYVSLLKPILVFSFAIAAGVCGLTQITQYRSTPRGRLRPASSSVAGIAAYLVRG
ncbi:Phospholipid phosphatase-related protein type 3 [Camelus dromedarius]|uniref:Phospholipid phosphatase-related protein type 3 n=1 Tax=Camelus dromedarius TaxID=9838 RepID=A0A5N4CLC8_CAMDR|nr:Phospholipid phosphatase-related protein type 3 [Camelus dromedarius]